MARFIKSMSPQKSIYGDLPSVQLLGPFLTAHLSVAFCCVPFDNHAPWGIPHRAFMSWSNLATTTEDYSGEFASTWRLRTTATMSTVKMSRTSMNRPSRTTNITFLSSSQLQSSSTKHHFPTNLRDVSRKVRRRVDRKDRRGHTDYREHFSSSDPSTVHNAM